MKPVTISADPWKWIRNRTLPLLVALVSLITLHRLFIDEFGTSNKIFPVAMATVPLFGLIVLGSWRRAIPLLVLFGIMVIWALLIYGFDTDAIARSPIELLAFAYYAYATVAIGTTLLRSTALLDDRVYGGLAVFLLSACMYATLHRHISALDPNAYWSTTDGGPITLDWDGSLYYSFVSITTVGFGDIVPRSPWARSITIVECATGIFITVVFIARLAAVGSVRQNGHPT